MHPYGDTQTEITDTRSPYPDDGDDPAARRTLRLLGVALFVTVLAATNVLSLRSLDYEPMAAPATGTVDTLTTLPPPPDV